MPFRSSLLAAGLGALVLAGCGSDDKALIPQDDADRLSALVGEAGDAAAAGRCDRARTKAADAKRQLGGLPRRTDAELKANLEEWLDYLEQRIQQDCRAPEPDETPTPTPTEATPSPSPSPTPTPPDETPTPTASPEPTVTIEPGEGDGEGDGDGEGQGPPEEPPGTGGVAPEDG
jgi:hypothetical protein